MKKILLSSLMLLSALLLFYWLHSPSSPNSQIAEKTPGENSPPAVKTDPWQNIKASLLKASQQATSSMGQAGDDPQKNAILQQAKDGKINLVDTLNQIRQRCPEEWSREECNDMTRNFIRDKIISDDQAELLALYDQYIQYEDFLAGTKPLQGLDLKATFETLQQARKQFFDDASRAWLFGAEDARMAYEFAKQDFTQYEAPGLDPGERLKRLEQIRQQTLGDYYQIFQQKEESSQYYQTQLELVQMNSTYSEEAEKLKAEIQQKLDEQKKEK